MKRIFNYTLLVLTVTFLFYLVTATNSAFVLNSLDPSYATSFSPAGKFKPGSGESKSSIPSATSKGPAVLFTPGAGNAERNGSSIIPSENFNPLTPIEPGYIPINLDKSANLTIIYNTTTTNLNVEVCVFTSYPSPLIYFRYEVPASPYCVKAAPGSTLHSVLAPGLIGTRVSSVTYDVDDSRCHFYIYPNESKACFLNFKYKSYLTTPQETIEQGGQLQIPNR